MVVTAAERAECQSSAARVDGGVSGAARGALVLRPHAALGGFEQLGKLDVAFLTSARERCHSFETGVFRIGAGGEQDAGGVERAVFGGVVERGEAGAEPPVGWQGSSPPVDAALR